MNSPHLLAALCAYMFVIWLALLFSSSKEFGWSNAFEINVSKPVLLAAYSCVPSYNGDFFSK